MSLDPKELKDFILVSQTTSNQKLLRGKNCPKSGMYLKFSEILTLKLQELSIIL